MVDAPDRPAPLNPLTADVLPDSRTAERAKGRLGAIRGPGGMWVPIYCAWCGHQGGLVPEKNMTFAFWLCTPCFKTHGEITNTMVVPDEVFFETIKQEQLDTHGRLLAPEEVAQVVADDTSALARLIKAGS